MRPEAVPRGLEVRRLDAGDGSILVVSYPLDTNALGSLTAAECDVIQRVCAGASNAEIARARTGSVRTVANLLARAYRKLEVSSRRQLVAMMEDSCVPTPSR